MIHDKWKNLAPKICPARLKLSFSVISGSLAATWLFILISFTWTHAQDRSQLEFTQKNERNEVKKHVLSIELSTHLNLIGSFLRLVLHLDWSFVSIYDLERDWPSLVDKGYLSELDRKKAARAGFEFYIGYIKGSCGEIPFPQDQDILSSALMESSSIKSFAGYGENRELF